MTVSKAQVLTVSMEVVFFKFFPWAVIICFSATSQKSYGPPLKQSIFEFAMTAELKKWRRIFYSLSLNLK